jgi:hypothetical protein
MLCKNVVPVLSEFLDEALDSGATVKVSQHLDKCAQCSKEFNDLSMLRRKLQSLRGVQAPDYLGKLIEHKLDEMQHDSWRKNLQSELERTWSKIRTTEGMWYFTKALGTVMTSLFFVLISIRAIPPAYMEVPPGNTGQEADSSKKASLGDLATAKMPQRRIRSDAAMNSLCLYNIGDSISADAKDDTFFVVTEVDPSGVTTIKDVLEPPRDQNMLSKVIEMISSARCRPASEKGKAVSSHVVYTFSKVTVHN